ncbi:MAG: dTDP-4-amino-4,6-dideoxygalactose transaminase [Methanoregulaceae archaeon]|nr:dTDP-4-amino-4,6-dideoxygalactose transaminase [Methanoregulaceae archaeon]
MQIPFNRPYLTGNELRYLEDVIRSVREGGHLSGDGRYTQKVQDFIQSRFGAKKALLTTSCTSALELATRLLNLKPGDEVIVPSYTFSSTVNPIIMAGGRPVFTEIQEGTLNIDPEDIRRKITPRTRAIFPMHYAGISCAMDEVMELAQEHDIKVVEDAAQAVNAKYKRTYLGTIGDFGCYSFHETKNYVCGEGGALLINTDDRAIIERAEIIREKGTNRSKFHRGETDKYTWVDTGSSYLPSDLLAAFLYAQLEKLDEIQKSRMKVWNAYYSALNPFEAPGKIRLPVVPDYADHNAHLFYILFRDERTRDSVMKGLKVQGIHAVFHYIPLHSAPVGLGLGYRKEDLPLTEEMSGRLLRLPMYAGMRDEERDYIITALRDQFRSL